MKIAEIKQQLTLSQVLQHYGLKPDKHARLHCPFHDDSTPSLQVYYKTHTAYCFSSNCKTHGKALDVIDFVMYKENCSKHEAIEKCKQLTHGNVPPPVERLTRVAVLTKLFMYFKNAVHNSRPAQEYLKSRVLDATVIEVGYNTAQFHHGERREDTLIRSCIEVGLLSPWGTNTRNGEQAYKVFAKNCIVFALRNAQHQVCGLYFRSTINNEDQRHFYLKDRQGLYPRYPKQETTRLILTESIIDAATILQVDEVVSVYNILALYGTNGFTAEHQEAIKALPALAEIIFWLNADAAGRDATVKYAKLFGELLPNVKLMQVEMPEGEDVNSLAQGHEDKTIFTHLLEARIEVIFSTEQTTEPPGATLSPEHVTNTDKFLFEKPAATGEPSGGGSPALLPGQMAADSKLDSTHAHKLRYVTATAHYYVQGGVPKAVDTMKVMLVVEHPVTSMKSRNRVDLYEDKQVEKLSKEVSEKLGLRRDLLEGDLYRLTDELDSYREEQLLQQETKAASLPVLTARERSEQEAFAKQPKLIKRLNELLGSAGIIGEERNRIFLLLVAISHKMPETLHALVQGSSGSGKTRLLKQITDCMPKESVTRLTRLSDKVLYNYPEDYFVNRLLCLEDMDGLSEEAEFAFRELQSNGELNSATSIKLENGQITSGEKKVRGPIASLACTTHGEIYEDNMSRVFLIAVDEGHEQTEKIIAYQNSVAAGAINKDDEEKVKQYVQNFVRILRPYKVINPYAQSIRLPPEAHKIRRLNDLLQSFIKMVTIVHQYQRERDDRGRLITAVEDIETAVAVMFESIVLKVDELDGSLRQFYERLKDFLQTAHGKNYQQALFSLREIRHGLKLSKTQVFRYAGDLVRLEYIRPCGGHANRGLLYRVSYWDNYQALREKIKLRLDEQLQSLKAGTPRNAGGTLESA